SYFLFGDNDITGRLPFALLGIVGIGLPFLARSYLGRWGALIAAALFAFSPILLYYSRFAREDIPLITWTLILAFAAWRYLADPNPKWLYVGAAAMALGFATKAAHFITVAIFGSFFTGYWLWQMAPTSRLKGLGALLEDARRMPVFGWLIMMGTITLPQLAAFLKLTPVISTSQDVIAIGPWVTTPAIFSQFAAVVALLLVAAAVGVWWNRAIFLTYWAVFFTIYGLLYTTFFTNLPGFGSGMWNMLSYWLDQHEVQRGGQPWYYYLLLIPQYEFLSLLVAGVGLGLTLFNARLRGWLTPFVVFLLYWFAGALFAYSKAGEKMPWLSVQIVPPLLLFAGWFLGKLAERVEWRTVRAWRSLGATALFVVATLTLAAALADAITRTPQGDFVVGRAVALLAIALALAAGGVALATAVSPRAVTASASLGLLALLFFLQLRIGWMVTYAHGDVAQQMLIYTQSTPDITRIYREIERLSLQTTGGLDLRISVDSTSGFTWPWAWYF
ncbi:MAG: TIGR03663 family protein, partial [Dehalococcoidia bacterium]|nr:TIGR03663 family protein [Dehalococcoidia bacterium]